MSTNQSPQLGIIITREYLTVDGCQPTLKLSTENNTPANNAQMQLNQLWKQFTMETYAHKWIVRKWEYNYRLLHEYAEKNTRPKHIFVHIADFKVPNATDYSMILNKCFLLSNFYPPNSKVFVNLWNLVGILCYQLSFRMFSHENRICAGFSRPHSQSTS